MKTEGRAKLFYIIFLNHPKQTLKIIQHIFQRFDTQMPVLKIRFVVIKGSSKRIIKLARIIELENPPFNLITLLQNIPGITVTDRIELL